jgi:hypothetical protein
MYLNPEAQNNEYQCLINLQGQISETTPQSFTGSLLEFRDGIRKQNFAEFVK